MDFLPVNISEYAEAHTRPEDHVLAELNRETWQKVLMPRMLSGHIQGATLEMFSRMIRPNRVLEIGTYTGYSAICMARGLAPGGKLISIDINDELAPMVLKYIQEAGLQDRIETLYGNAAEILPELEGDFDLVFIDADKIQYGKYLELVWEKMLPGGWIVADNVLWSGKVTNENICDEETEALRHFNTKVHGMNDVFHTLLPLRDGLMVLQKPLG